MQFDYSEIDSLLYVLGYIVMLLPVIVIFWSNHRVKTKKPTL